ncbi:DNA invertase Pin-like site-specific DNA recombinase [Oikeobacillus pervagus]|uniref:DNA invertase Pin-like site-specific DNA recombinase n=2 Tax=Oikeobacillus pervagus TaxID=1325931 RepID=A0AAJ1WKP7_9BACI|nr:DNA invertase Pin-like site-specific DNA recombinase [Oikeobacillus pervagus]
MGMTQRAREGKWNGGRVLGYQSINKVLEIVPKKAENVKLIFNLDYSPTNTKFH